MKFIFVSLLFVSASAFAATMPESISLICTGRQIAGGGSITGPFVLRAANPGTAGWKIEAGWQGKSPYTGAGIACGETLAPDKTCTDERGTSSLFSLTQSCGPHIKTGGVPRAEYISTIVLNEDYSYGYFNCQGTAGPSQHIQVIGCQKQ